MDVLDLIAVLCFGIACFSLGYSIGKDNKKMQE